YPRTRVSASRNWLAGRPFAGRAPKHSSGRRRGRAEGYGSHVREAGGEHPPDASCPGSPPGGGSMGGIEPSGAEAAASDHRGGAEILDVGCVGATVRRK